MNRPILMAAAIIVFYACGDKNQHPDVKADTTTIAKKDTAAKPSPYFPVYDFIRNEIEYVDSLPVGLMKYTTTGTKQDAVYIKLEEFHRLADDFLSDELKDANFTRLFRETSFLDKASNNATFFYKPSDGSTKVKRVDVLTAKGDVYDDVKSVYIEKETTEGDTPVVQKLYWKPKRNFQIITIKSGAKPSNELVKVVWDNRE